MEITKALAIKIAGGVGAIGTVATGGTLISVYGGQGVSSAPQTVDLQRDGGNDTSQDPVVVDTNSGVDTRTKETTTNQKDLGLPENCKNECDIEDEEGLKKINFAFVGEGELVVSKFYGDVSMNIEIKDAEKDWEKEMFPGGKKYVFYAYDQDITIKKGEGKAIIFKKELEYDFRKNDEGKLEKAWTAKTLGGKVYLTCPEMVIENSKCTFTYSGSQVPIKVGVETESKDLTLGGVTQSDYFTVTENQVGYNQGLKFTYSGQEISNEDGSNVKVEPNANYEIKYEDTKGEWILSKKN